jgi:hypothetical protein
VAVTRDKPAPYAPSKTILDIIGRYRQRGLPSPVDADVLVRAGVPESLIPRTLQALQTLDLIDDGGKPTSTFEGIRLAPETEYKKRLEDWLKGAYADVFSFVDPTTDDETRTRDAFRSYHPVGQQPRMATLFQGLCLAAGLITSTTSSPRSTATAPRSSAALLSKRVPAKVTKFTTQTISTAHAGLPAPLAGLLASLPANGAGWTSSRRKKFVATFEAVLDFCFPIVPDDDEEAETAATQKAAAAS